jgi:hypothetical protein
VKFAKSPLVAPPFNVAVKVPAIALQLILPVPQFTAVEMVPTAAVVGKGAELVDRMPSKVTLPNPSRMNCCDAGPDVPSVRTPGELNVRLKLLGCAMSCVIPTLPAPEAEHIRLNVTQLAVAVPEFCATQICPAATLKFLAVLVPVELRLVNDPAAGVVPPIVVPSIAPPVIAAVGKRAAASVPLEMFEAFNVVIPEPGPTKAVPVIVVPLMVVNLPVDVVVLPIGVPSIVPPVTVAAAVVNEFSVANPVVDNVVK